MTDWVEMAEAMDSPSIDERCSSGFRFLSPSDTSGGLVFSYLTWITVLLVVLYVVFAGSVAASEHAEGPYFEVEITEVPSGHEVVEGEVLQVDGTVYNHGRDFNRQNLTFENIHGEVVQEERFDLEGHQQETFSFTWNTEQGDEGVGSVEVSSEDDSDVERVRVVSGREQPNIRVQSFNVGDRESDVQEPISISVEEDAGVSTEGLTISLEIESSTGSTVYQESLFPADIAGEEATVLFGVDGGTDEPGPFPESEDPYQATATADADNAEMDQDTDTFTVRPGDHGSFEGSADEPEQGSEELAPDAWIELPDIQSPDLASAETIETSTGIEASLKGTVYGVTVKESMYSGDGYVLVVRASDDVDSPVLGYRSLEGGLHDDVQVPVDDVFDVGLHSVYVFLHRSDGEGGYAEPLEVDGELVRDSTVLPVGTPAADCTIAEVNLGSYVVCWYIWVGVHAFAAMVTGFLFQSRIRGPLPVAGEGSVEPGRRLLLSRLLLLGILAAVVSVLLLDQLAAMIFDDEIRFLGVLGATSAVGGLLGLFDLLSVSVEEEEGNQDPGYIDPSAPGGAAGGRDDGEREPGEREAASEEGGEEDADGDSDGVGDERGSGGSSGGDSGGGGSDAGVDAGQGDELGDADGLRSAGETRADETGEAGGGVDDRDMENEDSGSGEVAGLVAGSRDADSDSADDGSAAIEEGGSKDASGDSDNSGSDYGGVEGTRGSFQES